MLRGDDDGGNAFGLAVLVFDADLRLAVRQKIGQQLFAPRLLELARNATTVLVGPSVIMSSVLFEQGADALAGSVVADPEKARFAIKNGAGQFFGEALQMTMIERDRA